MLKTLLLALIVYTLGISACKKGRPPEVAAMSSDFAKGEDLIYKKNDSSYYYFNRVINTSKDSLELGWAYNKIALIQSALGDLFGSQESLLLSLRYLHPEKASNLKCLISDYNELGNTSVDLGNYDAAITYFDKALNYIHNEKSRVIIMNNKATAYRTQGRVREALAMYVPLLDQASIYKEEYARILTNTAKTRWLIKPSYNAAPELLKALSIRKQVNDEWGQNSSYAHLSDFYASTRPDSALYYARLMYAVARKMGSPDDQLEALQKLIRSGRQQDAKTYFMTYQKLSDSLQADRNNAKNQFALIRYETEKHKANNTRLQKENSEKKYQVIAVMVALVVALGVFVLLYQRRKRKAEQSLRENQLLISRRIHDVVANGLHGVINELQYQAETARENILPRLFHLYNQSRDISNEISSPYGEDFILAISLLFQSYDTPVTSVTAIGNTSELWNEVNPVAKTEIERVLRELMVNMKKHSKAREVVVIFTREGDHIHIQYADDGIGFPEKIKYGGGIGNTESRIKSINGTITFASEAGKGVDVRISFPVL